VHLCRGELAAGGNQDQATAVRLLVAPRSRTVLQLRLWVPQERARPSAGKAAQSWCQGPAVLAAPQSQVVAGGKRQDVWVLPRQAVAWELHPGEASTALWRGRGQEGVPRL